LWRVFSNVVKPEKTLLLTGPRNDPKTLYNFHESIINALRPALKEGVRSIVLASRARTSHSEEFINHVHAHHAWLVQGSNRAIFSEATGSASTLSEVTVLARTPMFQRLIRETTSEETENLVETLEKRLDASSREGFVLFSLVEIEDLILGLPNPNKPKPEYLMLTDKYLSHIREKNRIHRLMQIAMNRNIKTRIINAESPAGLRLTQLGGMVCFAQPE
jgi:stalled ribosome rescue protein Dom34